MYRDTECKVLQQQHRAEHKSGPGLIHREVQRRTMRRSTTASSVGGYTTISAQSVCSFVLQRHTHAGHLCASGTIMCRSEPASIDIVVLFRLVG
jgi:hypothetical protein